MRRFRHGFSVRVSVSAVLIALILVPAPHAIGGPDDGDDQPIGVRPSHRDALAEAESVALAVPNPRSARDLLRRLTEEPHVAGTPADRETALFVRDRLRDWGWTADLVEYQVLLNEPVGRPQLTITQPERRELKVTEDPYPADKDSASPDAWPAFHGYGVSGDVAGQVVYVNYGTPDDFDALEQKGIDVTGKIVLARYGQIFRGLKVLNAQRRGARAVLMYSDPADDGYLKGDIYPNGPYRPPSAIQRGSVQFLSLGPGDPSTPHGPSVDGAERLPFDPSHGFPLSDESIVIEGQDGVRQTTRKENWERQTGLDREEYFAAIPSLPISYEAAQPIFAALAGPDVPGDWQGGLPLAYHIGPGPVEVRLVVETNYEIKPVWNVIARLEGEVEPDRWVMIGNHRDAWGYGAVDPSSGTAATLEMCRALGEAVQSGWKPRRTLVYASWDAEEYGLVGSTEWADEHAEELNEKALLMLNVDSAVAGPDLDVQGIPSLRDLLLNAAADVTDPATGKPLRDLWIDEQRSDWSRSVALDLAHVWADPESATPVPELPVFSPRLEDLGSGSDYTAFVDHLGIPVMNVDFTGRYGVYHSIYDNYFWMERFGDPGFALHATSAKLYTLLAMRAASADVVPLTFTPYGEAMQHHVDDLRTRVARKALSAGPENDPPIRMNGLADLVRAIRDFQIQAVSLDETTAALVDRDMVSDEQLRAVNDALQRVERAFLLDGGLPGRAFFRHAIYAPGVTTGYASWPLPGLRQAIEEDNQDMFDEQLPRLIDRIHAATEAMKAAERAARRDAAEAKGQE